MSNLNVTYEEMHSAAAKLKAGRAEIEGQLARLKSMIDGLVSGGYVTDKSSKAFQTSYEEFNTGVNKTIEGLVGGGLSAILVGTLLHRMTPFSPLQAAAVNTVIVVAGFFGGFVLSAIKRDLKAKDWGYIIEGHGGVLDRVDSLTFAAPLFFHVTRYWFTV